MASFSSLPVCAEQRLLGTTGQELGRAGRTRQAIRRRCTPLCRPRPPPLRPRCAPARQPGCRPWSFRQCFSCTSTSTSNCGKTGDRHPADIRQAAHTPSITECDAKMKVGAGRISYGLACWSQTERPQLVLVRRKGPHEPEGVSDSVCAGRAGGGGRVQRPAQAVTDAHRTRRAICQDARHQERAQPAKAHPQAFACDSNPVLWPTSHANGHERVQLTP